VLPGEALSVPRAGAPFDAVTITRRDLGATDVLIDIAYTGVCHSDVHMARDDWGYSVFPMVPGHEITGIVSAVGAGVTRYAVGDRVAVGNIIDSCRACDYCRSGRQQYCRRGNVGAYNSADGDAVTAAGGFSEKIVVDQDFVLGVPQAMDMAAAAPLLCGGITMYSALRHWKVGPGTRVAIAGMGGLGHLGVKMAAAMGADVSVLSRTLANEQDGRRFGAAHYHAMSEEGMPGKLAGSFDLIVSAVSESPDTAPLLSMLDTDGTLVIAGATVQPLAAPAVLLITGRRSLAGTSIAGIEETRQMLDFCAAHHIGAEIEVIRASQIDQAFARLDAADVHYRFVIDASTFSAPS
jgi:alcohol dehydrogenase (NADP+)